MKLNNLIFIALPSLFITAYNTNESKPSYNETTIATIGERIALPSSPNNSKILIEHWTTYLTNADIKGFYVVCTPHCETMHSYSIIHIQQSKL